MLVGVVLLGMVGPQAREHLCSRDSRAGIVEGLVDLATEICTSLGEIRLVVLQKAQACPDDVACALEPAAGKLVPHEALEVPTEIDLWHPATFR